MEHMTDNDLLNTISAYQDELARRQKKKDNQENIDKLLADYVSLRERVDSITSQDHTLSIDLPVKLTVKLTNLFNECFIAIGPAVVQVELPFEEKWKITVGYSKVLNLFPELNNEIKLLNTEAKVIEEVAKSYGLTLYELYELHQENSNCAKE